MKITDIRVLSLSRRHEAEREWASATFRVRKADCAIVIVETDEGISGIGEASAYGVPPVIKAKVEAMKSRYVGKEPDVALNQAVEAASRGAGDEALPLAGIDCALWDLKGKIAGKKVCDLLAEGRPTLDRVRLYASAGVSYDWDHHPESLVGEAVRLADEGFTAMKMRVGTEWSWSGVTANRYVELIRKVHDAVGGRMELMVDGNCRLQEHEALEIGKAMDEMGFAWFEEPIDGKNIEGYTRLNAALNLPVTGGESLLTLDQIQPYLDEKAYSIVQVDAGMAGLSETWRVAMRAHEHGVRHCPHSWHNGLMCMAHVHMVAALPAPAVVELNAVQGPLQWEILREKPQIEGGNLVIPDGPGFGVELADDLEERFPYIEGAWGEVVER